jgi:hypothetical protein
MEINPTNFTDVDSITGKMNNIQKRFALFLLGCIPARLGLAYIAKVASIKVLFYMGILALLIATGFMYLFLSGARKTGAEVFGDTIWWNGIRPLHALLYFGFAYRAIGGHRDAWKILLADALIGLASFVWFHFKGNLRFPSSTLP